MGDDDNEWLVVVEEIWLSFDVFVVVVDDDDDVPPAVDNLLNERRVSGKFGGVAGVFAGVINLFKLNYIKYKNIK